MTRNTALTLTLGAAALVLVGTKAFNAQHSDRHVVQVASSASVDTDEDTTRSGYIIASS
jgi:hypothetical protein